MVSHSGPQRRALKLSRLGAVRRTKALRRAVRLQQRYLVRLNAVNDQIRKAVVVRKATLSALQALTDRATGDSPPSLSESGADETSASATELLPGQSLDEMGIPSWPDPADASSGSPTTTDPISESTPTESSISTSETSSASADAVGGSESSAA